MLGTRSARRKIRTFFVLGIVGEISAFFKMPKFVHERTAIFVRSYRSPEKPDGAADTDLKQRRNTQIEIAIYFFTATVFVAVRVLE